MNDYKVGQVLFVIPSDSATVIPVQIVEKRISETTAGTVIKHIIKSPKEKAPTMVLETVKGSIYVDLRQVRDIMVKNATNAIEGMVKHAANVAKQAFAPPAPPPRVIDNEPDPLGSADIFVDDDVDMTQVPQQNPRPIQMLSPPAQQMTYGHQHDENTVLPDISDDGMTEIMLADGTKQRVKLKMKS